MKIQIKLPKPRNPLALAARQRQAGEHGGHQPQRAERRKYKMRLQKLLSGRLKEGDES
ncbi:hypothetical protein [Undibacterium oligocarboniphilum]|uniref:Uncharacterized protein n=1 Tax=Undibacterium oligocarboniphilum TaxID=666702 RepID=A0A850QMJ7_9BURK|nr:hypothetical protein [Undibacterium oligocarboniphilum]MBC3870586.1 hypothetical protein [Undibacterium oligocarboniphilum]NVO78613.1 hypothetical protein [Undibacterium oligocarboniphilum]